MNDFLTDYLQSLHGIPILTHEDEWALADKARAGDDKAIQRRIGGPVLFHCQRHGCGSLAGTHHQRSPLRRRGQMRSDNLQRISHRERGMKTT